MLDAERGIEAADLLEMPLTFRQPAREWQGIGRGAGCIPGDNPRCR